MWALPMDMQQQQRPCRLRHLAGVRTATRAAKNAGTSTGMIAEMNVKRGSEASTGTVIELLHVHPTHACRCSHERPKQQSSAPVHPVFLVVVRSCHRSYFYCCYFQPGDILMSIVLCFQPYHAITTAYTAIPTDHLSFAFTTWEQVPQPQSQP